MRLDHGIGWSLNGFDLSGTDPAGVRWLVKDVEGWDDPASTNGGVNQNVYGDGGWVGSTFLEPQSLVLKARILAPTRTISIEARDSFKAIIPVRDLAPLVLMDCGVLKHRMAKQEGKPSVRQVSDHHVDISLQLVAPDPRMFSGDGTAGYTYEAETSLPVSTGGLQLGAALPWKLDAVMATGTIQVINAGDARPPVKLLLTDVVNPVISAGETQMRLNITAGPGQTLEVDLDARTVKLNGVNRRNALAGGWITPTNGTRLTFNASTYNPAARMTARWSDAWR